MREKVITLPQNELFRGIEILHEECYAVPQQITDSYNPETPFYVLDVGANVGVFTLYIKDKFPNAFVHAFEPSKSNIFLFNVNTFQNSIKDVTLHTWGLFSENGEKDFFLSPKNAGKDSLYEFEDYQEKVTIEVRHAGETLTWLNLPHIDILKIDTESSEVPILSSLSAEQLSSIRCIMVEYHNEKNRRKIDKLLDGFNLVGCHQEVDKTCGILKYVNCAIPLGELDSKNAPKSK